MSQELFFTLMIFMALFTLLLYLSQNDQANLQNPKPLEFHESKMGKPGEKCEKVIYFFAACLDAGQPILQEFTGFNCSAIWTSFIVPFRKREIQLPKFIAAITKHQNSSRNVSYSQKTVMFLSSISCHFSV